VFSPEGLFGSPHRSLRVTSVYLLRTNHPPYRSIFPERIFSFLSYPQLVLGDFNLHHPLGDPCLSLSEREFIISTSYFDAAGDLPYHLLNTPGVYTRFPFDTISRPSVLDLAFANTALSSLVSSWDTPLPSTGSDHVPCVITLRPPAIMLPPPTLHWALLNLDAVGKALDTFTTQPCPERPTPNSLSRWFDISSTRLTSLVTESAYCSRYCTYLMLDVSYSGSSIVALFFLPCTFLICYSFLLGYLFLSSLIAFTTLLPFRQPYAFLLVLLD